MKREETLLCLCDQSQNVRRMLKIGRRRRSLRHIDGRAANLNWKMTSFTAESESPHYQINLPNRSQKRKTQQKKELDSYY